jgi:hypothetical protein
MNSGRLRNKCHPPIRFWELSTRLSGLITLDPYGIMLREWAILKGREISKRFMCLKLKIDYICFVLCQFYNDSFCVYGWLTATVQRHVNTTHGMWISLM